MTARVRALVRLLAYLVVACTCGWLIVLAALLSPRNASPALSVAIIAGSAVISLTLAGLEVRRLWGRR